MRVFLSYNPKDHVLAESVRTGLLKIDPRTTFSFSPIRLGQGFWLPKFAEGIRTADAFLLLIGSHGIGPQQELEYYEAFARHVQDNRFILVPLIAGGGYAPGLLFLRRFHWLEVPEIANDTTRRRILAALEGGRADTSPSSRWKLVRPYRGLHAMTSSDADYFYGRTAETKALLTGLARHFGRLTVLTGSVGVGKSSVAQAGALSAFAAMRWPDAADGSNTAQPWPSAFHDSRGGWAYLTVRPGNAPLHALAAAFTRLWRTSQEEAEDETLTREWADNLKRGSTLADLIMATRTQLQKHDGTKPSFFFLYLDRGEELYTHAARTASKEATRFSQVLAEGLGEPDLIAFASLRSENLEGLEADDALSQVCEFVEVPQPAPAQLVDVVTRPAESLGVTFDDIQAPRHIAETVAKESDALPRLSKLLTDAWSEMAVRGDGILRLRLPKAARKTSLKPAPTRADGLTKIKPAATVKDFGAAVRTLLQPLISPVRLGIVAAALAIMAIGTLAWYRFATPVDSPVLTSERRVESVFWSAVKDSQDTALIQSYLDSYPNGLFAHNARALIDKLKQEKEEKARREREAALQREEEARKANLEKEEKARAEREAALQREEEARKANLEKEETARKEREAALQREEEARRAAVAEVERQRLAALKTEDDKKRAAAEEKHKAELKDAQRDPALLIEPGSGRGFRDRLADGQPCPMCPEAVVVPSGEFLMGSTAAEIAALATERRNDLAESFNWEAPQRKVTIARPFAVSRSHITRGEFAAFVASTGHKMEAGCYIYESNGWKSDGARSWQSPGFEQTDRHPIVCVSVTDATAYADWLSKITGRSYRLLSEAEAEYAARAAPKAAQPPRYFFGTDPKDLCSYGNSADRSAAVALGGGEQDVAPCKDGFIHTAPVASFKANAWGLHDVHGNVWTWTADCWNDSHREATPGGLARTTGDCSRRVVRGGSWSNNPGDLRAAVRDSNSTNDRVGNLSFRLARTL
ncbi:MAG: SUMF1/EgtB/PvdO family nonheme iron enzyme [Hyphomicrobiaceae bacterium]